VLVIGRTCIRHDSILTSGNFREVANRPSTARQLESPKSRRRKAQVRFRERPPTRGGANRYGAARQILLTFRFVEGPDPIGTSWRASAWAMNCNPSAERVSSRLSRRRRCRGQAVAVARLAAAVRVGACQSEVPEDPGLAARMLASAAALRPCRAVVLEGPSKATRQLLPTGVIVLPGSARDRQERRSGLRW
jgi:hypothetical protein